MTTFDPNVPHYVYVCYDAEDWVLYIGCSKDPAQRIRQHSSYSWTYWLRHVNVIGPMPTEDAVELEARLINLLAPAYNHHHNNVWQEHRFGQDVINSRLTHEAWVSSPETQAALRRAIDKLRLPEAATA